MPSPALTPEIVDLGLLDYTQAYDRQLALVADRISGKIADTLIFVEHSAVYTIGAHPDSQRHLLADKTFLEKNKIEVIKTNRGGDITHHAPGQLVVYPIVKIEHKDLHRYLRDLEEVIIRTLGCLGLATGRVAGKTGVWVGGKRKIAAIGVAVKQWVAYHGVAINVCNDLSLFQGIVPCGLVGDPVTSLKLELKENCPTLDEVKKAFVAAWTEVASANLL